MASKHVDFQEEVIYNGRKLDGGSVTTLAFGWPPDGGCSNRSGQSSVRVLSDLYL